ncbi:MAG: NAD(P)-binding domain-containing protein [Bacteroidetes bacterium]|nr:NAD(P)-binding domain-containing protein [Bacteroidota bacterium]
MKIGILGTGMVGNAIGSKLVTHGYEVMMGSRSATNEKAAEFVKNAGKGASQGTFAEAAMYGEIVFNCTKGEVSMEVLKLAKEENLTGKILIDVANPLYFEKGAIPTLSVCNTDSLGETLQRNFPSVKVVKTLNTMNCNLMVNASLVPGDHDIFICGNDAAAKTKVETILRNDFGWEHILDLGDITNARATEMLLPIWIRLYGKFQSPNFNFHIAK